MSNFALLFALFLALPIQIFATTTAEEQNANFIDFSIFDFTSSNSSNGSKNVSTSPETTKFFTFSLPAGETVLLNISLSTGAHSAVVVSALRCPPFSAFISSNYSNDANYSNHSNSSTMPRPAPAPSADWLLLMFADSLDYKSARIEPNKVPEGGEEIKDHCTAADQSLVIKVHEMLNGSRGTVALRTAETGGYGKNDGAEKAEESGEWLVMWGSPLRQTVAELDMDSTPPKQNIVHYSMDMGIRRGAAELTLLMECIPPEDLQNTATYRNAAYSRKSVPMGQFSRGHHRAVVQVAFGGGNGTILVTMSNRTSTVNQTLDLLNCTSAAQPKLVGDTVSKDTVPDNDQNTVVRLHPKLSVVVASLADTLHPDHTATNFLDSPEGPLLVALTHHRTFAPNATVLPSKQRISNLSAVLLIVLLSVAVCVLTGAAVAAFLAYAHRYTAHHHRIHYDNERKQAIQSPNGFFELDIMQGRRMVQRPMSMPVQHICVQELAENAVGGVLQQNVTRF